MNPPSQKEQPQRKIRTQPGLLAALDQSGGITSKALMAYGITEAAWSGEIEENHRGCYEESSRLPHADEAAEHNGS